MNEITIRRLRDVQKIDTYFASTMVDIAYIKSKGNDYIKVEPEDGIVLNNDNDRAWLRDLLEQALSECKETNAEIIFN